MGGFRKNFRERNLKEVILHFTDIDQDMIKVYKNTFPGLTW